MVAVLIFIRFPDFGQKTTLGQLVTMATTKHLFPIFELQNLLIPGYEKSPSLKVIVCSVLAF